eukprot:scaffold201249_cov46-Prasinocladus_malaysianus.AAC.1
MFAGLAVIHIVCAWGPHSKSLVGSVMMMQVLRKQLQLLFASCERSCALPAAAVRCPLSAPGSSRRVQPSQSWAGTAPCRCSGRTAAGQSLIPSSPLPIPSPRLAVNWPQLMLALRPLSLSCP